MIRYIYNKTKLCSTAFTDGENRDWQKNMFIGLYTECSLISPTLYFSILSVPVYIYYYLKGYSTYYNKMDPWYPSDFVCLFIFHFSVMDARPCSFFFLFSFVLDFDITQSLFLSLLKHFQRLAHQIKLQVPNFPPSVSQQSWKTRVRNPFKCCETHLDLQDDTVYISFGTEYGNFYFPYWANSTLVGCGCGLQNARNLVN